MSEASDNRPPAFTHQGLVRAVLAALGVVQLINGLWALLAPRSFYEEYPFGRGWVELLPAYNEHLMRDVGGLYLATRAYQGNLRRHSQSPDSGQFQGVAQTLRRGDGADAGLCASPEGDAGLRRA
jgi:hypothetical protein